MPSKFALLAFILSVCVQAVPANPPTNQPANINVSKESVLTPELKAARQHIKELEKMFKIKPQAAPYLETNKKWEAPCSQYWLLCPGGAGFFYRQYLQSIEKVEVLYTPVEENRVTNTGTKEASLKTLKSKWLTTGRTTGWSIDAKVSAAFGIGGGDKSVELGVSYSDSTTTSQTDITQVELTMTCPPGYVCAIVTWTFFAKVKGKCLSIPHVQCPNVRNMCNWNDSQQETPHGGSPPFWTLCQQFKGQAEQCKKPNVVDCEVSVPIFEQSGKGYSTLVTLQNKILSS
ncbi:hypothetical protein LOZ12_005851 [Ophidiomyces ophidiicola]|uniref:Uncharacterized protein n=1 Tax=Ophidiomyces ophidiicola TaxID=1387563 RepID=A0ACB8UMB8_9EURO|nr:uncharacterized protein LOZ57_001863 [Ophidiomyces ophidiicola]KAI1919860.1 hypothetical protein LOZ64_002123 [Ophidiomyces ophidiicola]KAI1931904.1 hypothetical protein LOZ62_006750 [Ophidiomyces ophidiicola]KAI1947748.1 hypothetical protein LOZ59_006527 [Ophidiomyces ophidiicola]KAI1950304.1 hypothetical protein LOZ57_001863 [Ophidiomyces ophidiicola]KAI2032201.1 hypothetical protein LOZ45_001072 [Ophidiomyces ophidiicola]